MVQVKIDTEPLNPQSCFEVVQDSSAGGIAVFVGTVRNQTKGKAVISLEFEAYRVMAISEMEKIAQLAQQKWNALHIAIHHRVGRLQVGEIAVIIAVSTPHRQAAFDACAYCIDTLKQTVPIWKKEIFEDGETWVAAHP